MYNVVQEKAIFVQVRKKEKTNRGLRSRDMRMARKYFRKNHEIFTGTENFVK